MNKVKRYIEVCHICLKTKPIYMKNRPVYGRIPVDYAPMQDLSIDIKTMPQAFGGYHLLLVITCDQTNFTIVVPLRDRQTQTIAEALIYRVIYLFSPPRWIVCDKAAEFTSAIIKAICKVLLLLRLAIWWRFCLLVLSVLNFWGMFVRVYPKIVQDLTFLNSVKHITIILAHCTS